MTATVVYKGDLRCESMHMQSGSIFETDAPTDNRGRGERFSPTDTLCVSLATCMITTMAIKASDMNIDLKDTSLIVTKHMIPDPRRVGKIEVILQMKSGDGLTEDIRNTLEKAGDNCPVMKSLHPNINVVATYLWQ